MFDGKAFGAELVGVVKDYLERHLSPVDARIEAVERQISGLVVPVPFDDFELKQEIAKICKTLAELPAPIDGKDGRDGIDGKDGEKGEPGERGERGEQGEPGLNGKDGSPGTNGRDGLDAVEFLRGADGHLVVTLSNGTTRDLGEINGKDGAPGINGADADADAILERVTASLPVAEKAIDFAPEEVAESVSIALKAIASYTPKVMVTPETKEAPTQPININMPPVSVSMLVPEQKAPVVNMAAPTVTVEPAQINVELPKRGKEVTRVTEWDKTGRIKAFERTEEGTV